MSHKYTYGVRTKRRPKLALILVGLMLITLGGVSAANVFGVIGSDSPKSTPVAAHYTPVAKPKVVTNYGLPVRLQIPKLQIDANVKYLGIDKGGRMDVPIDVEDAGWYKYSSIPGSSGTAVIGGHLTGKGGVPGVFVKIDKLAAGDTVTVTDSNGRTIDYTVRETKSYDQDAQPDEVFKSTSGSHLNLITCSGGWDAAENRFTKRLVVFTDKAD